MNNLNWEYLFHGKATNEMSDIFKPLLNRFKNNSYQWEKLGKIRKSNPNRWMVKLKLIREIKKAYQIQKANSTGGNQ